MSAFCYIWGFTDVNWKNANWNWGECPDVGECVTWTTADVEWNRANMLWSDCTGSVSPPVPPTPISVFNFTESLGVDATTLIQPWIIEPWNPYRENRKPIISLVCNVQGKMISENKKVKKPNVRVTKIISVIRNENVLLEFKKLE